MKLACSSKLAPGDSYQDKLANLERLGFEGIEVRIMEDELTPQLLDEIDEALSDSPIKASSVLVPGPSYKLKFDSIDSKNAKVQGAKVSLDVGARYGAGAFITPEYAPQSPLPLWDLPKPLAGLEKELFYRFLGELAEYAEKISAIGLLEPINRYETHFYHKVEDVMAVIDRVGSPRIKIVPDFFHMSIEEADIPTSLEKGAGYIYHIQLGDNNRFLPGKGHTDFVSGFAALRRIGYDRYMALECRMPMDPEKELRECVNYLQKCLQDSLVLVEK